MVLSVSNLYYNSCKSDTRENSMKLNLIIYLIASPFLYLYTILSDGAANNSEYSMSKPVVF